MQVRIGQCDRPGAQLEHKHMRIVRADIILQQQPFTVARGRGFQSRVVKLQCCRLIQPAHESRDAHAVLLL